eukprot:TRINITY_DN1479_c0_g1_i3.p1 TRINITY_DN1479_c0_g1~~TRINITY_DN1479_c0_g1_i3.p1  ORF type:complete len:219 (-),score=23.67 TRINITY_DN1479_c0_g1_i3:135-791(-)
MRNSVSVGGVDPQELIKALEELKWSHDKTGLPLKTSDADAHLGDDDPAVQASDRCGWQLKRRDWLATSGTNTEASCKRYSWEELEEKCGQMDAAHLRITELDLTNLIQDFPETPSSGSSKLDNHTEGKFRSRGDREVSGTSSCPALIDVWVEAASVAVNEGERKGMEDMNSSWVECAPGAEARGSRPEIITNTSGWRGDFQPHHQYSRRPSATDELLD